MHSSDSSIQSIYIQTSLHLRIPKIFITHSGVQSYYPSISFFQNFFLFFLFIYLSHLLAFVPGQQFIQQQPNPWFVPPLSYDPCISIYFFLHLHSYLYKNLVLCQWTLWHQGFPIPYLFRCGCARSMGSNIDWGGAPSVLHGLLNEWRWMPLLQGFFTFILLVFKC